MQTCRVFVLIGILFLLMGHPIQAAEKKVFDVWKLGPFIEGKEIPPKDLVILLKLASVAPEGSTWYNFAVNTIVPQIETAINGLITVKVYGGGIMGDEADTVRKMRMKQLQAVAVTNMGLTMMVPDMCVFELPFLFDWEPDLYYNGKYCEIDYILEKLEPSLAELAAERELQFVGNTEACVDFITSQVPITSVEDFKKLKFWLFRGDQIRQHINNVFGFRKVTSAELFTVAHMFSTGMVDSSFMGWYVHVILQWWPHVKYVTDYPVYGYESASVMFDKRVLNRLVTFLEKWGQRYGFDKPQDLVRNLLEVTDRTLTQMRFVARRDEVRARKGLVKRGAIQEVHFPEPELEKLRKKILPLYDKLADKLYPRWLLDKILKYRQEYRTLKTAGKLTADWYDKGIIPDGDQRDQWRTEWER